MDRLSQDIVVDILSRIPLESLLYCAEVCRKFRHIILHDPIFAHMHLLRSTQSRLPSLVFGHCKKLYLIDFNSNDRVAGICFTPPPGISFNSILSCNGLLCLCEPGSENPICVANPVTGDHIMLPRSSQETCGKFIPGFGFDAISNEYKVVRITHPINEYGSRSVGLVAEVYTVGSSVWRSIGSVPFLLPHEFSMDEPINIHGVLHWLGKCSSTTGYPQYIVAWDVKDEKFYEIPMPENPDLIKDPCLMYVTEYRNCLSVLSFYDKRSMTLWMLKDYYSRDSWIREERQIPSIREWDWEEHWTKEAKIQHWYGRPSDYKDKDMVVKVNYSRGEASFREAIVRGDPNAYAKDCFIQNIATHVGSFISVTGARHPPAMLDLKKRKREG